MLADAGHRIYVAADNSFYYFDKETNTTTLLSRRDELSSVGVQTLAYDSVSQQLLVAYQDANLDLLSADASRVRNIADIKRKQIAGTKAINNIYFSGRLAYLACDFGIVVLDINRLEVRDTYSNIGPRGAAVKVYAITIANGLIFAATERGLFRARLAANLADFRSWTLDVPGSESSFRTLVTHNGQVYAGRNSSNLLRYSSGSIWDPIPAASAAQFRSLTSSPAGLLFTDDTQVSLLNANGTVTVLRNASMPQPTYALRTSDGAIYVADRQRGLVRTVDRQNYEAFMGNAPQTKEAFGLLADARSNTVTVFTGGYQDPSYVQAERFQGFYEYHNGRWTNFTKENYPNSSEYPNLKDLTRGARTPDGTLYVGSYGQGLLAWKGPGDFKEYSPDNSPLLSAIPNAPYTRVTDVAVAANGDVWVASRHPERANRSALHVLTPSTDTWRTIPVSSYPGFDNLDRLVLDDFGAVWVTQARKLGSGMMAYDDVNKTPPVYFSQGSGLPSNTVFALAKDRKGAIWATTNKGIAYIDDPSSAFTTSNPSFTLPYLNGFPALNEEVVRAVAVDGANRKWFGTDRGLWLLSEAADKILFHFTTENSPLPTNQILDVAVNDRNGEVFVATTGGVVSYKGSATVTEGKPDCAKVTPNPVRTNFTGQVGVSGLANNSIIKITDVSGKLVYQTTANGGTVTWNLADYNGRKVQSGVYLVLSSDADGKNGCVSKIAVVEK